MVKFILDGNEIEVAEHTTILNAARSESVDIPTFCYQDRLSTLASCRMCLVEVEGRRKLEPACATPVSDGMVVMTRSDKVVNAREDMLEILLANHPLDCPVCDKGGECELQDTVFEYGKGTSRLHDPKRVFRVRDIELNDVIVFNANRCIQCQRCVRVCEEVVGEVALGTAERGLDSEITGVGNSLSDCSHCGNCIEICPVGALMSTPYRYRARPWDLVRTETTCNMCGTGCSLTLETRDDDPVRVKSNYDTGLNGELLCAKGRFGFDSIAAGERIESPMIRKDGQLVPADWSEAIRFIADQAASIRAKGGTAEGHISARQTNETAYLFAKMMDALFGTASLTSGHRFSGLLGPEAAEQLRHLLGGAYTRGPFSELLEADTLFILGANITEENPVSGYLIREAMRDRDMNLIVASSRPCGLDDCARAAVRLFPGDEACLLEATLTGIPADKMSAYAGFLSTARPLASDSRHLSILIGTEFLRSVAAPHTLRSLLDVVATLRAGGLRISLQFLFDRPNQLGVWDMGFLGGQTASPLKKTPDVLPAFLYVVGADPLHSAASDTGLAHTARNTDCLVVQDTHWTETARHASVVLPSFGYGEEDGTYTNNEGRVQKVSKVRAGPEGAMASPGIFTLIAAEMDRYIGHSRADKLYDEIRGTVPGYGGLANWTDGQDLGLTQPVPQQPDRQGNASAKRQGGPVSPQPVNGADYLITGDAMFTSGSVADRSATLRAIDDSQYAELNPGPDIDPDGTPYMVTISHGGASCSLPLKVNRQFSEHRVFVPESTLRSLRGKLIDGDQYPAAVEVSLHPVPQKTQGQK